MKIRRTFMGKSAPFDNYVDMDCWIDDKTVQENPHKGWYWHFIDNGAKRKGTYRDKNVPGDYLEDFKGFNILYLRIDWVDIEEEDGVYDWSIIDDIMNEWGPHGYTFSFRVCTYECGDCYGTPKYVFEKGAKKFVYGETADGQVLAEPIYDDPIFIKYLSRFMKEFGKKFNGDKRVEYVDVGTMGTWGEGHTHREDYKNNFIYPNEVVKLHMDLHAKNFPDTQIILNYDSPQRGGWNCVEEKAQELMEHAKTYNMGLRCDSLTTRLQTQTCLTSLTNLLQLTLNLNTTQ